MDLLQQHSGWKVDGQITPGLLWKEDVGPGCRASPAVGRRGLKQHLCWLGCRAAGRDGACTQLDTIRLSWTIFCSCKMVDPSRQVGRSWYNQADRQTHTHRSPRVTRNIYSSYHTIYLD